MKKCPRCGTLNDPTNQFCNHCRAALTVSAPGKVCPVCHAPNRTDAKFCAKCQHRFERPALAPVRNQLPDLSIGNLRVPLLLIAMSVLIFCGLCAIALVIAWPTEKATRVALPADTPTPAQVLSTAAPTPTRLPSTAMPTLVPTAPTIFTPTAPLTMVPTAPRPMLSPTPGGSPTDALDRAKRGTVLIFVSAGGTRGSSGSGSVITKRGHILTNHHVVENARGNPILIGYPPRDNLKGPVEFYYRAEVMASDAGLDLALLRLTAQQDGSPLPNDLGLGILTIGNSDSVDSPDPVTVLGYPGVGQFPGLGQQTLTITTGTIAGFSPDASMIKIDAEINPGNSGGPAINRTYEQIGVASMVTFGTRTPGKIGWIRPINLARPMIEHAKRDAGE